MDNKSVESSFAAVSGIAAELPSLTALHLARCKRLTDDSAVELARARAPLATLDLQVRRQRDRAEQPVKQSYARRNHAMYPPKHAMYPPTHAMYRPKHAMYRPKHA
eukprot:3531852-Pyramimonas_sp.AAC.1